MEKVNRVILNIGMTNNKPEDRPEPDLPLLTIDGTPINNVNALTINAGAGIPTTINICFFAEVGGFIGTLNVRDEIRKAEGE